jgi:hypothetical protein
MRRAVIATVAALTVAAATVIAWRAMRPAPTPPTYAEKRAIEARVIHGVDAAALRRAGDSADAESDRAALALVEHDAAAALAHATRALQLAPGHPQAAWNRALALRDLGLVRAAVVAFQAIAARGEKGWSDEAKSRAATMRAAIAQTDARASAIAVPDAAAAELERAFSDAEEALHKGEPARAETAALAALARARAAGVGARDLLRRLYVVLADATRAEGKSALADAYVDEARLLLR